MVARWHASFCSTRRLIATVALMCICIFFVRPSESLAPASGVGLLRGGSGRGLLKQAPQGVSNTVGEATAAVLEARQLLDGIALVEAGLDVGATSWGIAARRQLATTTACAVIPGYTVSAGVDRASDNIAKVAIADAAAQCNSDARCKGFNSRGWLKSVVTPVTAAAKGSCFYVKKGAKPTLPTPSASAASQSSPIPSSSGCADVEATLVTHNKLRALHGSPAMSWNESLAKDAQAWANSLASKGCGLSHSSDHWYGENLFAFWGWQQLRPSDLRCADAVDAWYGEVSNYKWTSTPWTSNKATFFAIGHFTQVVWKSSRALGCGAARGASGGTCLVVCCRYTPPGNYATDALFLANVPKLIA